MKKILTIAVLVFFVSTSFSTTVMATGMEERAGNTGGRIFMDNTSVTQFARVIEEKLKGRLPQNPGVCCIKKTYMVPMRDGVRLATDVYLPLIHLFPHGSILLQTPYGKEDLTILGDLFALLGWPTIIQDMRGRGASEGNNTVFRSAHTDGPDTLAWISDQRWSNGKVATVGPSALGICQYFMAGAAPPNLAGQGIMVASPNLYKHAIYQGGEFRKELVEIWLKSQDALSELPEIFAHENYTLDFWTNVTLDDKWPAVNIPAIHMGGWYDAFQQGIIDGYIGYQHYGGLGARGKSKLVMGPWTHEGYITTQQGILRYPGNSLCWFTIDMFIDLIKQYTMNETTAFDRLPNVSYYVMGDVDNISAPGNEWRYATDWPIPATNISWYFHHNGELTVLPPGNADPLVYTYDPNNPVPTLGGQTLNFHPGPRDQTAVETRPDVLVFTSSLLTQPYEATGPITARLFVSSDCPDTDFTVKLSDVYPDGRSMVITDGILRMRNRNSTDHWEFMEPGMIYNITVNLWSTSYIWNTGHCIRVAVSSSNYPRFQANPNTADPMMKNITYQIAHNTLYIDSTHLSSIILPNIPQGIPSTPPDKPRKPLRLQWCMMNRTCRFFSSAVDPDGDQVSLMFDWGDGTWSGWLGPFKSGKIVTAHHVWHTRGTYTIRVKAKDVNGTQSEWSSPLNVHILSRNRMFIMPEWNTGTGNDSSQNSAPINYFLP